MGSEHVDDLDRRAALARAVRDLLLQSPHVVEVRPYGSLGAGGDHSDRYSDIDLVAVVDGLSDRAFATKLPGLLIPLGRPLIAGWGLDRLPDTYVRTLYLENYPLFWHVDIGGESSDHEPGADIAQHYHWPQIFKMWIAAVKQVIRDRDDGSAFLQHISRWADISSLRGSAADRLGQSLELCVARARRRGAPCEEVYRRRAELRSIYLT
ncbi:hypothetical protein ABN034_12315 [Actinopolymorpha sp. B11F2]|uniref:hypothetical protein n=1 Tax=Actinopolymorpha sp. B11F2 TaxID=3160862 RepID=UPI0032E42FA5